MADTPRARGGRTLSMGSAAEGAADSASVTWRPFVSLLRSLKLARSDARLSRYSIFVALYATAFLLEMAEPDNHPISTFAAICLAGMVVYNSGRVHFLGFLIAGTAYFLIFRFPEVANHANLMIFCNLALIAAIAYSYTRSARCPDDGAFFEMVQPILRLMIIITFGVAGFHKLNSDFIDPEASCIANFSGGFYRLLHADFLGMPAGITIGLVALGTAFLLWRHVPRPVMPEIDVGAILLPVLAVALCSLILLSAVDASITSPKHWFIFVIAVIVLCWQLLEAPLLFIRRFQWFALCLCLLVHAQLAMIGIVDFQSLGIALLMTFIPGNVLDAWHERRTVNLLGIAMHRVHAYFLLNLTGAVVDRIDTHVHDFINSSVLSGLLFNISVLILLWPMIIDLFSRDRQWRWDGVQVLNRVTPAFLYVAPIALLLFGLTSHFGLRTAGNFSMFSNLRTEGDQSNHLLFGNNPLKFTGYQEDVVKVHAIDDETAKIGHHYVPLEGAHLPVVEFRKLIALWREADRAIPMTFEYDGKIYATENVVAEPDWQVEGFDWEMRLLDFRVIQPEGPNRCRW